MNFSKLFVFLFLVVFLGFGCFYFSIFVHEYSHFVMFGESTGFMVGFKVVDGLKLYGLTDFDVEYHGDSIVTITNDSEDFAHFFEFVVFNVLNFCSWLVSIRLVYGGGFS